MVLYLDDTTQPVRSTRSERGFRTARAAEEVLTQALERVRTGTRVDPAGKRWASTDAWPTSVLPSCTHYSVELSLGDRNLGRSTDRLHASCGVDAGTAEHAVREPLASGRTRGGSGGLAPRSVAYVHGILMPLKDGCLGAAAPKSGGSSRSAQSKYGEMKVWTAEQAGSFIAQVANDRLYAMWAILLTAGCGAARLWG